MASASIKSFQFPHLPSTDIRLSMASSKTGKMKKMQRLLQLIYYIYRLYNGMFDVLIRLLQLCRWLVAVSMGEMSSCYRIYFGILQVSKLDFFKPGQRLMYKKTPTTQNSRDKVCANSGNVCGSQTGSYQA